MIYIYICLIYILCFIENSIWLEYNPIVSFPNYLIEILNELILNPFHLHLQIVIVIYQLHKVYYCLFLCQQVFLLHHDYIR